jgi:methylenetetrahydrofolate--tRNA-(uracil-5-)-methyltransferase
MSDASFQPPPGCADDPASSQTPLGYMPEQCVHLQVRAFDDALGLTGLIITKLDGTAKGGIVVAVQRKLGVPVKLVGLGEGPDDLAPFDPEAFVDALITAERVPLHAFEAGGKRDSENPTESADFLAKVKYFAGCTPIEAIADKGRRSLAFGNFKPVGLDDPRTGRRPYAALQLRPENREKTLYSLVACQNRLRFGEQRRVFRLVPGLANAEFVRYGVIHRNTYIDAPRVLEPWLEMRDCPNLFVTGQLTGVEGYVESAAMGILTGLNLARRLEGLDFLPLPRASALGSLTDHLQDTTEREFAPMNINWGLFPEPEVFSRDKGVRRSQKLDAAHAAFAAWLDQLNGH